MSTAMALVAKRVGGALLPDNAQWTNRIEIKSETSSRLYTVATNKATGVIGCSCPGWRTRRHCKHLAVMAPLIAAAARTEGVR
jgi:hypothetical protein